MSSRKLVAGSIGCVALVCGVLAGGCGAQTVVSASPAPVAAPKAGSPVRDDALVEVVRQHLAEDAAIAAPAVEVSAEAGVVTLTGEVRTLRGKARAAFIVGTIKGVAAVSALAKKRVETLARVGGVDEVDSQVKVLWWSNAKQLGPAPDVAVNVRRALALDPRLAATVVVVSSEGGLVTLRGTAPSLLAREACLETAANVTGVTDVINDVRVVASTPTTDEILAQNIRDLLAADADLADYKLEVEVRDGVAALSGEVDFQLDKNRAEQAASRAAIRQIDDTIRVNSGNRVRSDREIKDAIESRLMWNPYVEGTRVAVKVESGVAVLEGTLTSRREIVAAIASAREAGAHRVTSHLTVGQP